MRILRASISEYFCDKDGHLRVNRQGIIFPSLREIHTNGQKKKETPLVPGLHMGTTKIRTGRNIEEFTKLFEIKDSVLRLGSDRPTLDGSIDDVDRDPESRFSTGFDVSFGGFPFTN